MGVFYVLLLIPMMMQHFAVKGLRLDYQKRNIAALKFFFVFLTLLVALRHESVGNDTRNYLYYYDAFGRASWSDFTGKNVEIGFQYLNKFISLFSRNPQFYLATAAILVSAMIWPTYKRLCVDTAFTVSVFCILSTFVMMFSGIRQMLAIGLGFIAYDFTRKRKLLPFVLICLLALTVHTSAFMLMFMYPLYHARITRKSLMFLIPILAALFAFNQQIFGALGQILAQFTDYDTEIELTGAYTMLILFGLFLAFSFLIPDENVLDEETTGLRNFLLLTFALQMFAPLHTLAMRMGYYYMIFVPLLLPKIVACRSRRWGRVALLARNVMVGFFLLYFFVSASGGGGLNVFPYHFFWERV